MQQFKLSFLDKKLKLHLLLLAQCIRMSTQNNGMPIYQIIRQCHQNLNHSIRIVQRSLNLYFIQYQYIIQEKPTKMAHSGYQKDRFVNLTFDEFDCIICSQVVMDPIQCDMCGKLFCKICINDWINKNPLSKCPNRCANSNFTPVKSKALLRTYNNLQIRCCNSKCTSVVKLGDLKQHQQICLKIKCWNYEVCNNPQNESLKFQKPCCSKLCNTVQQISSNMTNRKKLYQILTQFMQQNGQVGAIKTGSQGGVSIVATGGSSSNIGSGDILAWDSNAFGTGIVLSQGNTHVFLKQQAYVFRTIVANNGFSSGVHYWEIVADSRTQNQIKIGVTSSKAFDFNSAFCDHPFGWAYYGLGQLRHGSNATGPAYGKRFKKEGVLGICLDMNKGTLSFSLNGQNMGVAYNDQKLKSGTFYPAVSLLHCAGCKIRQVKSIPACFN